MSDFSISGVGTKVDQILFGNRNRRQEITVAEVDVRPPA